MARRDLSPPPVFTDPLVPQVVSLPAGWAEDSLLYGVAGRYYPVPTTVRTFTTSAPASGQVCYIPVVTTDPAGFSFDRICVEVTTLITGSVIRIGLYSADGATGQPKTLLADYGTASGITVGVKEITASGTTQRGLCWMAVTNQMGAPTLRSSAGAHPMVGRVGNLINANSTAALTAAGSVPGAYPAAAVAPTLHGAAPVVLLRAA